MEVQPRASGSQQAASTAQSDADSASDSDDSSIDPEDRAPATAGEVPKATACEVPKVREHTWPRLARSLSRSNWIGSRATDSLARRRRTERRVFWDCAAQAFHPEALVRRWSDLDEETRQKQASSLEHVFQCVSSGVFGSPHSCFANYRHAPPGLNLSVSFFELLSQYTHLLDVIIPELLNSPAGLYCFHVSGVFVSLDDGCVIRASPDKVHFKDSSWHDAAWGKDSSISLGSKSAIGRQVVVDVGDSPERGRHGVLHDFDKIVIEPKLYKMLMTLSYRGVVQPNRIWHVLRLYHRVYMASVTTEALAELIGSLLTQRVQCQVGRHVSLADCIGATKLRCAGIRGDPRDVGFITRCLNIYFRGKPWHFSLSDRGRSLRAKKHPGGLLASSVALHRHELSVRTFRNFSWIANDLSETWAAFGRRNLKLDMDVPAGCTTTSGLVRLQSAKSLQDLTTILRDAQARFTPDMVDPRVWQDLLAYLIMYV